MNLQTADCTFEPAAAASEWLVAARGVRAAFCVLALLAGSALAQTGGPRTGLTVTMPNGFAAVSVDDLVLKTTAGDVRWNRSWNGQEWKFNPQWESLSQSWRNLTGSQAADTTGIASASASTGGSGGGCWVTVDEDWRPPAATSSGIVPMIPARSTPFNRAMSSTGSDYPPEQRVTIDHAALCPGVSVASSAVDQAAYRRGVALYLGDNGRYSHNNRLTLEKRPVLSLSVVVPATAYAQLGAGQVAVSTVSVPNGFRWLDRAGDWIDFNNQGQAVAFGDRNDNTVWMQRDTTGIVRGVVDANGRVLYTLHYTGELLTEVKDYPTAANPLDLPARSVRYEYDTTNRLTHVTDARGFITRFEYDNGNHLVRVTDQEGRDEVLTYKGETVSTRTAPDGGVTDYSFEFDSVNKQFVAKVTGPSTAAGRRVDEQVHNRAGKLIRMVANGRVDAQVSYDTGARTESMTNARGFVSRTTRNEFDQVVQVQQTDGSIASWAYSAAHLQVLTLTDQVGTKTEHERDGKGNLLRMTQAAGLPEQRVTEYTLNALGQTTQVTRKGRTEADGRTTPDAVMHIDYDALGHVKSVTDPEGKVRHYSYDRVGNLNSFVDPLGRNTRYQTDALGNLTQVSDPLGRSYVFIYDKVGNLTSLTDARGKTVLAVFDAMNRLVQTTNAVGGVYKRELDTLGQVTQETDEDGKTRQVQFDIFQRLSQITDGLGNLTKLSYLIPDGIDAGMLGSLSGPTQIHYPTFSQNQRYDQRDRSTINTLLNANAEGQQISVSQQAYDRIGQPTQSVDAYGKQRTRDYNALRQVTTFTDTLNAKTRIEYDARGNLLSLTDALNNTYRFTYDRNDRVIAEILPLGQQTTYQYDDAGNLAQRIDPNGNKAAYDYDDANRLKTIQRFNSQNVKDRDTRFTWDDADNLTAWSDTDLTRPAGQQISSAVAVFDDANRKISEVTNYPNPAGGTYQLSTGYSYSKAGRKTQLIWPDGTAIGYDYSPHGQLQSVNIPGEGTLSVNSYKWVVPTKITFPGGTTQEQTFDGLLKQQGLRVNNPAGQPVLSLDNRYGSLQELQSKLRTDSNSDGTSTTTSSSYVYDDEVRLRQATTTVGNGAPDTETFTLDASANRVAHSKTEGVWTYDANNRLLQSGTGSTSTRFQWDESGNQTERIEEGGRAWKYRYDSQNRLIEVRDGQESVISRYGYDALNRRLWKEVYRDSSGSPLATGQRYYFAYADEGLIGQASQTISSSGQGQVQATEGPKLTEQFSPKPNSQFSSETLFRISTELSGIKRITYYHNDHLSAPILGTKVTGADDWRMTYGSFGEPISYAGSGSDTDLEQRPPPHILPGQYFDSESQLSYNFHRVYSPKEGSYIQSDPIGLSGGTNLYGYANASPLVNIDPLGLACVAVGNVMNCTNQGYTFSFEKPWAPAPWRFPDTFDSPYHHDYEIRVCTTASAVDAIIAMIKDPTPGVLSRRATTSGSINDATPILGSLNPILSVHAYVKSYVVLDKVTGQPMVLNVTLPGHPLYPGYVLRTAETLPSGITVIRNIGEGSGRAQSAQSNFGFARNGINWWWKPQSESLLPSAQNCECPQ